MRRILIPIGLLAALLSPAEALAQGLSGIVSGSQLVWVGSGADAGVQPPNRNQLYLTPGQLFINDVPFPTLVGPVFVTQTQGTSAQTSNFSFASDVPGLKQAINTAYYVYAANNYGDGGAVGGRLNYVISTTPPNEGGDPVKSLAWTPDGGHPFSTTQALFLGSYITDPTVNHVMVPFLKKGDEVILSEFTGSINDVDSPYQGSVQFSDTILYPWIQTLAIEVAPPCWPADAGASCAPPPIPLTASALLIDFVMQNQDPALHDLRILNPLLAFESGGASCETQAQFMMTADNDGLIKYVTYNHARIKTAINTYIDAGPPGGGVAHPLNLLSVAGCEPPVPGSVYSLTASYVGYVEVTHHLGY